MTQRPALSALATRMGILPHYVDNTGVRRPTSDDTRVALLAAMGLDASSEDGAERTVRTLDQRDGDQILAPVRIVRTDEERCPVAVRLQALSAGAWDWTLELVTEEGDRHRAEGSLTVRKQKQTATVASPIPLPWGYHRARVTVASGTRELRGEQLVIIAPSSCRSIRDTVGDHRLYGLTANLYSVRSEGNWGVGDLGDLGTLLRWAARIGASFVGLNPLHAIRNRGWDISPYGPVSRLYRNPLYLDIGSIPEFASVEEARAWAGSAGHLAERERLRSRQRVDYEGVMALKKPILNLLHRSFVERRRRGPSERARAYEAFCSQQGQALDDFATFLALEDHLARSEQSSRNWRRWPLAYQDPGSTAVRAFRRQAREDIDFHRWVQFELDRQLAMLADQVHTDRMAVGLFGDLAVGSSSSGSDGWVFPHLFVHGAHLGAPPDDYSAVGQDWGLPPIHPVRLREDRYLYWILLVRNAMRHFGALRIDHVMGLFRQFWIPAGRPGTEGAYVRFPAEDLLAIVALESRRHGTVVIGEDLGTVPRGLPAMLARWSILSTRVLYFERDRRGRFRAARRYSPRALVTAATHDHPPLAGFWEGRDLFLRRKTNSIATDEALQDARDTRARDRQALVDRLRHEKVLDQWPQDPAQLAAGVYRFLGKTPSPLVGVSLDDLAGEVDPVNLPGVNLDRYQSWSRKMRLTLETMKSDPDVGQALDGIAMRKQPPANSETR